jgi:hypothetical protein
MVYAFSLEPTGLARTLFGLLGSALLIDLAPAAVWILTVLPQPAGVPQLVTAGVWPAILAFVLFLYGIFGLGAIWFALHGSGRTVRADDWGLSITLGKGTIGRTL